MNPQDSLNPQNSHPTSQPFWDVTACFFMFDFILQLLFSPFGMCFFLPKHPHGHWQTLQKSPANQGRRTPRLPGRKAASSYTSVHVSSLEEHPQTVHELYNGMLRERGTSLESHRYMPFFFLILRRFVLHTYIVTTW